MENVAPTDVNMQPRGRGRPAGAKNKSKTTGRVRETRIHPDARPLAPLFTGACDHEPSKGVPLDQQPNRFKKMHAMPRLTRAKEKEALAETGKLNRAARDEERLAQDKDANPPAANPPAPFVTRAQPRTVEEWCEQQ